MSKKILFIILIFLAVLVLADRGIFFRTSTQKKSQPGSPTQSNVKETKKIEVVASNLEIPWGLAFLPDGRLLVTERPGTVRVIGKNGNSSLVTTIPEVKHIGEGGLLGITLHPRFKDNGYIYVYYTYSSIGDDTLNRVSRFTFKNNGLTDEKIIVDAIPGAANHNGGRIKFAPDGFLYITTGDAQNPSLAQDKNSLAGKILRVTDDGEPAPGNPFNTRIYSFGHRNPQGLAWDANERLWATEHGRSGVLSGLDELNLIESGKNYGWPVIQGNETATGMESPRLNSGNDTWAPAGLVFLNGSLYFGGLRGQALYETGMNGTNLTLKEHLENTYGRIRDVILGPDGMLYITTSNRDGRGNPQTNDDKIVKIDATAL